MAAVSDQEMAIARVYAGSILELAQATGDVDVLLHEWEELAQYAEKDAEFASFLSSPIIDTEHRRTAIENIFRGKCTDLLVDSLQVLNRKGRLSIVRALAKAYRHACEELQGRIEVWVRSASPLTDDHRDRLRDVVHTQTQKQPELKETVDPSILGGLIVQIGDRKLDSSIVRKLRTLSDRLLERASREIHSGRSYYIEAAVD